MSKETQSSRSLAAAGYETLVERVEALAVSMRAGCTNTCIAHPYPRMHTNAVCRCVRSAARQLLECAIEAEHLEKIGELKVGDFDVWYKPCQKCGYDTGKSTKDSPARCWSCGERIERDYSARAVKKPHNNKLSGRAAQKGEHE